MFNIIASILALVLMIGAGIAGLTYLGPSFTVSEAKAELAKDMNQGLQVDAAMLLYRFDNGNVTPPDQTAFTTLVAGGYLDEAPSQWLFVSGKSQKVLSVNECNLANAGAGYPAACPSCTDPLYSTYPACDYSGDVSYANP